LDIFSFNELNEYLNAKVILNEIDSFVILSEEENLFSVNVKIFLNTITEYRVYTKQNDEFIYSINTNKYYFLDGKIVYFNNELDPTLYSFIELNESQRDFFIAYPNLSVTEILNATHYIDTLDLEEYKLKRKEELSVECQNYILSEYSIIKQINIINLNGYKEEERLDMNLFIFQQRNKYSVLCSLIDQMTTNRDVLSVNWNIDYNELLNYIISLNVENSLDVLKMKKIEELKLWDKNMSFNGYEDTVLNITLATMEGDIVSFTKDLTGLNSLINKNESLPEFWLFLDKNSNIITTISPNDYISLLNRYFIYIRNLKMQYGNYLIQIYNETNASNLSNLNIL